MRSRGVDLTIATSDDDIEFRVRYLRADPAAEAPAVEALLAGGGAADAPLTSLRRAMNRVEFGRQAGVEYCALVKALPPEPA